MDGTEQDASHSLEQVRGREAALREILQVISECRDDERPVFDAILKNATLLCDAPLAYLAMTTEDRAHVVSPARRGAFANFGKTLDNLRVPLSRSPLALARAINECRVFRLDDIADDDLYRSGNPDRVSMVEDEGARSLLVVPLVRGGLGIGSITLYRRDVAPFSDDDVALVEAFAAQAVIAIDNVRQFRELQTRLEREATSREILGVISQSRDDGQPAYEAICASAARLCNATRAGLHIVNDAGTDVTFAANWGGLHSAFVPGEFVYPLDSDSHVPISIRDQTVTHIVDLAEDPRYKEGRPTHRKIVDEEGFRTLLSVPLIGHGRALGAIAFWRTESLAFSEDEIALARSFAAQAVIAIENVQQFRELQARLEREAATREILQVISRSREDYREAFERVVDRAQSLTGVKAAWLFLQSEDGQTLHFVAQKGASDFVVELFQKNPPRVDDPDGAIGTSVRTATTIQVEDIRQTQRYRDRSMNRRKAADADGIRSTLHVPLVVGDDCVGTLALHRQEVGAFSDDIVLLVENFARQAAIALENARQFRELQTRLEREAASGEILTVISQSRDDELPVFKTILENALRLCDADMAVVNAANDAMTEVGYAAGINSNGPVFQPSRNSWPIDSEMFVCRAIKENRTFHTTDLKDTDLYRSGDPTRRNLVDDEGMRIQLVLPLRQGDKAIAAFSLYRRKVQPFSDSEIALLETFAAQAVIAIENVRQFRDLQIRLEREAASRDILEVISQSRDDETPVFDALLRNAARLCKAENAGLVLVADDETHFSVAATLLPQAGFVPGETLYPLDLDLGAANCMREARIIHRRDVREVLEDKSKSDLSVSATKLLVDEGVRTTLWVPLRRGGVVIGSFGLYRHEVREFVDDEIALVETFAAQAVIAIENVRQFRELQTRLEREAASREILEVISQSRDDAKPVFEILLGTAQRLCNSSHGAIVLGEADGEPQVLGAHTSGLDEIEERYENGDFPMDPQQSLAAKAIVDRKTLHFADLKESEPYQSMLPIAVRMVEDEGICSSLYVPLISNGVGIGCLNLHRREQRGYSVDEIALVETFAAQAVIAIENVRQFRELQTRLEREAASRDVLQVISQSRDDEGPVFDVILENAARLCRSPHAGLHLVDDARENWVLTSIWADQDREDAIGRSFRLDAPLPASRAIMERRCVQVADLTDHDLYRQRDPMWVHLVEQRGMRTLMAVPLMQGDEAIGSISMYRREVEPFREDEIELVKTFTAQAVIAIENVRQFRELQTRLEREKATGEVLSIISQSRDVEQPVFDAILESSARLCNSPTASLFLLDKEREALVYRSQWGEPFSAFEVGVSTFPMSLDIKPVQAVRDGRTYHVADIAEADTYLNADPVAVKSVDDEGIRTLLSVPLMLGPDGIGCINLVRREVKPFDDRQIELVKTFAAQAVIAIENVRQFKALESRTEEVQALNSGLEARVEEQVGEIERMGKLKSFLPSAVADAVVSSGSEDMLKSHRALLGILFCDIRGFTAFCETAEPEETMAVLQTYHQEMGRLIAQHNGGVDHRMGDGIMVLFNDPLPCEDPAGDAVRLAMAMREKMVELCKEWKKLGHRLGFGVGVSLGYATVGMVGYEGRADYTASGTAVNLAARLCDKAGDGEILLSPRAAIAVEDEVTLEPGDALELKGLAAPVEVMKAVSLRSDGSAA